MILLADSEGPDQTVRMHRLIWAFTDVCLCLKTCFHMVAKISLCLMQMPEGIYSHADLIWPKLDCVTMQSDHVFSLWHYFWAEQILNVSPSLVNFTYISHKMSQSAYSFCYILCINF